MRLTRERTIPKKHKHQGEISLSSESTKQRNCTSSKYKVSSQGPEPPADPLPETGCATRRPKRLTASSRVRNAGNTCRGNGEN